jgi:DNA polymerase III subunit alpha
MQHYTPLHLHTEFSLLDGAIGLKPLVEFAKEQGWKACAITDHGNVFGAVKFFQLAKKAGIKPILGVEMYFTPDINIKPGKGEKKYNHLSVIVKNEAGYKNLCQLLEFAYTKGFYYKPRIDYQRLEEHNEGLIILSGCMGGHISQLLLSDDNDHVNDRIEWFVKVFGKDRFFIEVMPSYDEKSEKLQKLLISKAEQFELELVATPDSHYLKPCDNDAHEIMLSIGTKALLTDPNRMTFGDFKGYLKTTDEMLEAFKDNPEAVWNSGKIADSCNFEFTFGELKFPKFDIPKEHTEESFFKEICTKGLDRIFAEKLAPIEEEATYRERLKTEVDLIVSMGFIGYFLVVSDFIDWAKNEGIPVGPGRGSAAGSLVAWALKITNIDPIAYNLIFERFLNPERVSMPDIDIDFCIERRENVINYVKEKYGHDSVCQIITFGTMMAKGVIKDVGRVLGFNFQDTQALTDLVGDQLGISLKESIENEPKLAEAIENSPRIKHLFDICFTLEGLTRHASKHAAGVVIAPEPLKNVLPLYIPSKSQDLVTQYAMTELEAIGYLKMDFLGLKNLTIIDRCTIAIEKRHGVKIDLDKLPMDDAASFKTVADGKTSGIFQFEGDGVTKVLQKLKPSRFEDLVAVNALYRPGPLGSGMVDDFIAGRHGKKKVTYMFKELKPILEETYGVIVYQEQVMKIASTIAGFSLGAADILRRAMGKKKVEVMAEQKALFVRGATDKGFNLKKSGELFDLMAYFAGYGFNKSHSAAYALISYQTAYLKTYYLDEFTAALLSFETGDPAKLSSQLYRSREAGVNVIRPDINESEIEFCATDSGVRFGLKGIKNLGESAIKEILMVRDKPFKDIFDFCKRVSLRTVNKRVVESLIYSGALDSLEGTRAQKFDELETIMARAQSEKDAELHGQVGLFQAVAREQDSDESGGIYQFTSTATWNEKDKLQKEKDVVGFYLSSHPLDPYKGLARWVGSLDFEEFTKQALPKEALPEKKSANEEVSVIGLLKDYKVITTRKGDKMAFAEFENFTYSCEVIIFPSIFKTTEPILEEDAVFIIRGTVDTESLPKAKIKASEIIKADSFFDRNKFGQTLKIKVPESVEKEKFEEIVSDLKEGRSSIEFEFQENGHACTLTPRQKYDYNLEILKSLEGEGCDLLISFPEKKRFQGYRQNSGQAPWMQR